MLTTATDRRGTLKKRLRSMQTFRSVLSVDVEHRGFMPNLKISARNTIQDGPTLCGAGPPRITGAQDVSVLGEILWHLVHRYRGRGFTVERGTGAAPGFVGDVVSGPPCVRAAGRARSPTSTFA